MRKRKAGSSTPKPNPSQQSPGSRRKLRKVTPKPPASKPPASKPPASKPPASKPPACKPAAPKKQKRKAVPKPSAPKSPAPQPSAPTSPAHPVDAEDAEEAVSPDTQAGPSQPKASSRNQFQVPLIPSQDRFVSVAAQNHYMTMILNKPLCFEKPARLETFPSYLSEILAARGLGSHLFDFVKAEYLLG